MRIVLIFVGLLALNTQAAGAQERAGGSSAPSGSVRAMLPRLPAPSSVSATKSEIALVVHRAKVFGDATTAAGTRYFKVTDADLIGKSEKAVAERLAVMNIADAVRRVEIVVDLRRPIALRAQPGSEVAIGSAIVSAKRVQNLEVRASIFAADVVVKSR
jgi:hypothetical protein